MKNIFFIPSNFGKPWKTTFSCRPAPKWVIPTTFSTYSVNIWPRKHGFYVPSNIGKPCQNFFTSRPILDGPEKHLPHPSPITDRPEKYLRHPGPIVDREENRFQQYFWSEGNEGKSLLCTQNKGAGKELVDIIYKTWELFAKVNSSIYLYTPIYIQLIIIKHKLWSTLNIKP